MVILSINITLELYKNTVSVITTFTRRSSLFLRSSVLLNKQGDTSKRMNDHRAGADVVSQLIILLSRWKPCQIYLLYKYKRKVKCNSTQNSCSSVHREKGMHMCAWDCALNLTPISGSSSLMSFNFPEWWRVDDLNNNLRLRWRSLCFENEQSTGKEMSLRQETDAEQWTS